MKEVNNKIKEMMNRRAKAFEAELYKTVLKQSEPLAKTVYDAMNYSLSAGGKRLRPVLMLMCAELFGLAEKDVMPFACALEMIHTYSLIHDDLPAMDNDDLRRGKPTNHKVYGEAMAILAGDALLNLAAETVSSANYSLPAGNVLKAINELFRASGADGMIGGQVIDIESEGKEIAEKTLKTLHKLKTGALIRAAGRVPAALAGLDGQKTAAITAYCENLGVAFQIRDDLLDVCGSEQELGKKIGSDAQNHKTTYVTMYGIEKSEELVKSYTNEAILSLHTFGSGAKDLAGLANYLTDRRN